MEGLFVGLTPIRRRADTIITRPASLDNGKAWTTARCNRLLRPLISRVSALGRLPPSENRSAKEKLPSTNGTKCEHSKDEDSVREGDDGDDDGEWAPVKKKLKRTYSARLGKGTRGRPRKTDPETRNEEYSDIRQRMPFLVPGEISVATPILIRAKGGPELDLGQSSSFGENWDAKKHKRPKSRYLTKDGEAHFELSEILRRLRRKTGSSRYTLYEGIYNGLEVLLKATMAEASPTMQDRTGVRSLFNTCLRAVPVVIKEEELFALEAGERSAVEVRDVSSEIYSELEALGHGNRGWRHLRTIVRTHGIQIVGDAITQDLVRTEFAHALVMLCVHLACLDEAEVLISCLLKVAPCQEPKSVHSRTCDDPKMLALSVLDKFAGYTGRRSFQVRQLKDMLVNEQLSLAWLGTKEFGRVWTHVIQSASDPDSSTFLAELLPMLCTSGPKIINFATTECVMQKALDATFASVLTALSAIHLLNTPQGHESSPKSINVPQKPGTVLRQCLIACSLLSSPSKDSRASLLAMSNLLISPEHDDQDLLRQISKMLSLKPSQKSNDSISSFICSVACCCGRGAFNSGFDHLQLLHSRLREYFASQTCSTQRMIWEVMVDSAFAFARRHDECEHLDYAEDLESEFHAEHIADLPRRLPTEAGDDVSTGFRWEEGISEWVTATPAYALRKAPKPRNDKGDYESGSSPLCHNPRRGNKRQVAPRMFTQITKHMKPSQENKDRITFYQQTQQKENAIDLSSESEDDPLDISMPSLVSDHNSSSLIISSQSGTEPATMALKKHHNGWEMRPRHHGLRGNKNWRLLLGDESDDELSSSTTTSWNTSIIKRNKISENIPLTSKLETSGSSSSTTAQKRDDNDETPHLYSTRQNNNISVVVSKIPSQQQKRKRTIIPDTDSEDELCL